MSTPAAPVQLLTLESDALRSVDTAGRAFEEAVTETPRGNPDALTVHPDYQKGFWSRVVRLNVPRSDH